MDYHPPPSAANRLESISHRAHTIATVRYREQSNQRFTLEADLQQVSTLFDLWYRQLLISPEDRARALRTTLYAAVALPLLLPGRSVIFCFEPWAQTALRKPVSR